MTITHFLDTFTDADDTPLPSHTPDVHLLATTGGWNDWTLGSNDNLIIGNRITPNPTIFTSGGMAIAEIQLWGDNNTGWEASYPFSIEWVAQGPDSTNGIFFGGDANWHVRLKLANADYAYIGVLDLFIAIMGPAGSPSDDRQIVSVSSPIATGQQIIFSDVFGVPNGRLDPTIEHTFKCVFNETSLEVWVDGSLIETFTGYVPPRYFTALDVVTSKSSSGFSGSISSVSIQSESEFTARPVPPPPPPPPPSSAWLYYYPEPYPTAFMGSQHLPFLVMMEVNTPALGSGDSAEIDLYSAVTSYLQVTLYSDGSLYAFARDEDSNSWEYPASGSLAAGPNSVGLYVTNSSTVQLLANGALVDGTTALVNLDTAIVDMDVGIQRTDPDDRMGISKVAIYTNLTLDQALVLVPFVPSPDVGVTMSQSISEDNTAGPGVPQVYTVVATNLGNVAADVGTITDDLPEVLAFVSCSIAYAGGAAGPASATRAELAAGLEVATWPPLGTVTLTINTEFETPGTCDNTVTVAGPSGFDDLDASNNAAIASVTIGPYAFEQTLTTSDVLGGEEYGWAVDLSNDGNTLIVGSGGAHFTGSDYVWLNAAYVYTRSGGVWTLQQKVQPSSLPANGDFGWAVALSADGNTALVSAEVENKGWVFTRSGGVWTQQQVLVPTDFDEEFGYSVALSGDGNTALIGAASTDGAAYVFTRSGGSWTQQHQFTGPATGRAFGWSVSLSNDGNTAIVGSGSSPAPVYIYTRSGSTWTEQQVISEVTPNSEFGLTVDLSSDGDTAVIGGPDADYGYAYVYTRSAGVWTLQQTLSGSSPDGGYFGLSVSLSKDSNTLLAYERGSGAGRVFQRSAGVWTLVQSVQPPAGEMSGSGASTANVAISADGSEVVIGSSHEDNRNGAVYTFALIA